MHRKARILQIFDQIHGELTNNHARHVQLLLKRRGPWLALKFTSVDNNDYKKIVKKICEKYAEELTLIQETTSTLTYTI